MIRNNTTPFSQKDLEHIRKLRAAQVPLRRVANRYACSTTKILCALGQFPYPKRQQQQQAVTQ
jgi:hypothetical protein